MWSWDLYLVGQLYILFTILLEATNDVGYYVYSPRYIFTS